jgi:hypothetical protein
LRVRSRNVANGVFEVGQPVFGLVGLIDLSLKGIGVDRVRNRLAQVVTTGDGLSGLVGLYKKGEQVREFDVFGVGLTADTDRGGAGSVTRSGERT